MDGDGSSVLARFADSSIADFRSNSNEGLGVALDNYRKLVFDRQNDLLRGAH